MTMRQKTLDRTLMEAYVQCNIALQHRRPIMAARLERFFEALIAPLARQLEGLPPSAARGFFGLL